MKYYPSTVPHKARDAKNAFTGEGPVLSMRQGERGKLDAAKEGDLFNPEPPLRQTDGGQV